MEGPTGTCISAYWVNYRINLAYAAIIHEEIVIVGEVSVEVETFGAMLTPTRQRHKFITALAARQGDNHPRRRHNATARVVRWPDGAEKGMMAQDLLAPSECRHPNSEPYHRQALGMGMAGL